MPIIPRARHIGYDWAGRPVVRVLEDVVCADTIPAFLGSRHVSYASSGSGALPVEAYAWNCCDGICTPAEIGAGECYFHPDLWPYGPGPGITKRVAVYVKNIHSCQSAATSKVILTYSGADGKWHGSLALRGCTLSLTFSVNPGLPDDAEKFQLDYSGGGDAGTMFAPATCTDPIIVHFDPYTPLEGCCDCPGAGSGSTTDNARIRFSAAANCRAARLGRHVGFDDTAPLVAVPRLCPWDTVDEEDCAVMTCPVVFSVSADGPCACMAGDWTGSFGPSPWTGKWAAISIGNCDGKVNQAQIVMSCAPAGQDAGHYGLVHLHIFVICPPDNEFEVTGDAVIRAKDLDTLDVTFVMTEAGSGSTAACCIGPMTIRVTRA